MGIRPAHMADQRLGIGIEQKLVGIESVAGRRLIGAMDAVTIDGAGPRVGQITVPDLVGLFRQGDTLQYASSVPIEPAQLGLGGASRETSEDYANTLAGRPECR